MLNTALLNAKNLDAKMLNASTVDIIVRRVQLSFIDRKLKVLLVPTSVGNYNFPTGLGAKPVEGLMYTPEMLYPLLPNDKIFVGQINRVPQLTLQENKQVLALDLYILIKPNASINSYEAGKWYSIEEAAILQPHTAELLDLTLNRLREDLNFQPVEYYLLPRNFTIPEFHSLYEIILAKKLNRRNFNRKMSNLNIMEDQGVKKTGSPYKAPNLYQFNKNYFNKPYQAI